MGLAGLGVGGLIGYLMRSFSLNNLIARLEIDLEQRKAHHNDLNSALESKESQNSELMKQVSALETKLVHQESVTKEQIALLEKTKERLSEEFENLANRIFEQKQSTFSAQSKLTLENSLSPLRRDIGDFRKQVKDAYEKETADRNKLVGQISELQKQTMRVSEEAVSLANALRGDTKMQGNWGEFVLEKLLEDSGLNKGREYDIQKLKQDEEGKNKKPDVIVHLPEGKDIVIDSKVSLVAYERYHNSAEDEDSREYLRKHLNSLKAHIKGLSDKNYDSLEGINSLDFVLLFVPIEAAFMLALNNAPEIMTDAYDRGIVLVSPSTLMVTLKTIKNLWRYDDQNRNAKVIAERAGKLYDGFARYVEALDEAEKYLQRSQDALGSAKKRLLTGPGNLIGKTEELKKLGAKTRKQLNLDRQPSSKPQLPGAKN